MTTRGDPDREGLDLLTDPRRLRDRWLADMSALTELYMKSPVFLESLRCSLTLMNQAQSLMSSSFMRAAPKAPEEPRS